MYLSFLLSEQRERVTGGYELAYSRTGRKLTSNVHGAENAIFMNN
jgi:hypothetical protein